MIPKRILPMLSLTTIILAASSTLVAMNNSAGQIQKDPALTSVTTSSTTSTTTATQPRTALNSIDPCILLINACYHGDLITVQQLIDAGTDVNIARASDGVTPLFMATQEGHLKIVTILLQNGARVDDTNHLGTRPLYTACQYGHKEIAYALIAKNADLCKPHPRDGTTPLKMAQHKGYKEIAQALIQAQEQANTKTQQSKQLPECSANTEQIEHLPEYSAMEEDEKILSVATMKNNLLVAIRCNYSHVVCSLIEEYKKHLTAADINSYLSNGTTLLIHAIIRKNLPIIISLLAIGADPNMPLTEQGRPTQTPLAIAMKEDLDLSIVDALLNAGAEKITRIPTSALELLNNAASLGQINAVATLLRAGVNPNQYLHGAVPLLYAAKNGHAEIVKLLIQAGANPNASGSRNGRHYNSPLCGHTAQDLVLIEQQRLSQEIQQATIMKASYTQLKKLSEQIMAYEMISEILCKAKQ